MEDKNIEDRCKEYTEKLSQKLKNVEGTIAKKAGSSAVEQLQRGIEDIESKLKQLEEKKKTVGKVLG